MLSDEASAGATARRVTCRCGSTPVEPPWLGRDPGSGTLWRQISKHGRGSRRQEHRGAAVREHIGRPQPCLFADGLAEELRSALIRLGKLKVIGRASCEAVRNESLTDAARKLGVATVLTGSVRRSPTLIRVSAQLVDGKDGVERWSETYDRAPGDALQIQSGIAQSVASALRIRLGGTEKAALTLCGTRNAAAQDLFLHAQAMRWTLERPAGIEPATFSLGS